MSFCLSVRAPAAGTFLGSVVDERVPQAVGLGLVVGGDLERERLAGRERRASVQADAGDARHGELDGQYVALLAGRKIPRRAVDRPHGAVREGFGIEGRGFERGAVEPEAARVPGDHLHSPTLRSEEHTSELPSLMRISYAVFCLKKKT